MRISVTHCTAYQYDGSVRLEPQTFRLRPREDGAQRLLRYSLDIAPAPAGQACCLDQDGNVALEAWFDRPVEELTVTSAFEVETIRDNPFDFLLADSNLVSLPLSYREPLRSALAPYLALSTQSGPVWEFAGLAADAAGGQTLAFLTALNRSLFETFRHVVRDDGPPHPPEITLRTKEASCRDLALVFCAACRSVGIAARFVSGYEREAADQPQAYMHAWAEVYLPGGGWRGYDPSQGLAVANSHIAVAAAADPRLAAPVSGAYRGAARSTMEFTISMQLEDSGSAAAGAE